MLRYLLALLVAKLLYNCLLVEVEGRFLDFHVMNLTGFRDIFSLMFFFNETESIISELRYLWLFVYLSI